MKRIFVYIAFLTLCIYTQAAPIESGEGFSVCRNSSMCIMKNVTNYGRTIYEPFNPAPPSAYSSSKAPSRPGSIRRTEIIIDLDGTDDPDYGKSEQFPVGEPWIMGIFAALMAGWIYRKRKRTKKNLVIGQ